MGQRDSTYYADEGRWLEVYKHDARGAIAAYTKAIELSPAHAGHYAARARCYVGTADYDRAIADYTRALELNPAASGVHVARGITYLLKDDYEPAIADFSQDLLYPQKFRLFGNPYYFRALAYLKSGDYDRAVANSEMAFREEPSEDTLSLRAIAYNAKGEYGQALALHRRTPMLHGEFLAMGTSHRGMGEYKLALADYDSALKTPIGNEIVFFERGVTLWLCLSCA